MPNHTNRWQVLFLIFLFLFLFPKLSSESILEQTVFLDQGGRTVTLPPVITKVYTTTEAGLFLAYAIDPDSILGWNRGLSPELQFAILPQYHELPTLGSWDERYQTIHLETILELKPDLIIHYAPIDETNQQLADRIEETFRIPTIMVDSRLRTLPESLRLFGQLLGKETRGQALATFVEQRLGYMASFQELQGSYAPIPVHIVSPLRTGYYDELLSLAGMVEMPSWNDQPPLPDLVLIQPHSIADPYRSIEKDGHKRIYQVPAFPQNWLDPGSIFSLLGVEWLHCIAYPNIYKTDLTELYGAFMEIFFQLNLTPELLTWTLRRSGITY